MISEVVVLLAFLCYVSIRKRPVSRPWGLIVSMLFWGAARLLMELSFRGGSYEYSWGSLPSLLAAACLFFSLLFLYIACAGRTLHRQAGSGEGRAPDRHENGAAGAASRSERIKQLLDEESGQSI